jgi:hypothetical protein
MAESKWMAGIKIVTLLSAVGTPFQIYWNPKNISGRSIDRPESRLYQKL